MSDLIEAVAASMRKALVADGYHESEYQCIDLELLAQAALDAVTATHTIVRCYCGHPHTIVELPQPGKQETVEWQ